MQETTEVAPSIYRRSDLDKEARSLARIDCKLSGKRRVGGLVWQIQVSNSGAQLSVTWLDAKGELGHASERL